MKGLQFVLPEGVNDKALSVVEVGPFHEQGLAAELNKFFGTDIKKLTRINTYALVHPGNVQTLDALASGKPFVDPIIHRATLNKPLAPELGLDFDYVLQSMLNPGTSDMEGNIALQQALLALGHKPAEDDVGFYVRQYFLEGNVPAKQLEEISAFLANPDLNTRLIMPRAEYAAGKKVAVPIVTLPPATVVKTYDLLSMSDAELVTLNKDRKLAGSLAEMRQFRDLYKDEAFLTKRKEHGLDHKATDVELETWFGLRSEHCFHKEFNARITLEDRVNDPVFAMAEKKGWLGRNDKGHYTVEDGIFKTFIEDPARTIFDKLEKRGKNWIMSMFEDNAGVVAYDENHMFCIKFETHNSPSNKEPVQGAKTGKNGVRRDTMGTFRGIFDTLAGFFAYSTGNPHYKGWLPKGVKHPYVILKGITQGVREAGNELQDPTLGGLLSIDPRFIAKCLVYCGEVGFAPQRSPEGVSYLGKCPSVGHLVLMVGQSVGIDGLHGATQSSLSASADIGLGHVQADFSFIQAKMKGFFLEAARRNLFTYVSDMGAMGLGSAADEAARFTSGITYDLAKHPTKFKGIQPWQIKCSETQDRMLVAIDPSMMNEVEELAALHDVQIAAMGKLTDTDYVHNTHDDTTCCLLPIDKLFDKEP
ncbi:MAG: AIR synthase-related protein, partial [Nanoarchaeota archaeon]